MTTKPNWIDRALAEVVPTFAMRRLAARRAFALMGDAARSYDAAKQGRRTDGWVTAGSAANAEIGPQVQRIRNRSRDLVRNDPLAARAVRLLTAKIVGTGIRPRLSLEGFEDKAAGRAIKQQARDDWNRFSDHCDPEGLIDFCGVEKLAVRATIESGEGLIQLLPRPSSANLAVPLQIKVLEPDHMDMDKTRNLEGGGVIIQGVEYDSMGRRVAYWLFDQHPGEALPSIRRTYSSTRHSAEFILPILDIIRPGQVHGVPWLAPVAMKLRDLSDLEEARIVKKKIEACFAVFVTNNSDGAGTPLTSPTTTDANSRRIEQLSPGTIQYLRSGEGIEFANPSSSEGDADALIMQMHEIAAGVGLTYSSLTGDLRRANYSSMRGGDLNTWPLIDDWQQLMTIPQACRPVWRAVDNLLVATGRRQMSLPRAIWDIPARPLVDPGRDGKAIDAAIRAGRKTLPQAIAEAGRDPDEQLQEINETNGRLDDLELTLDTDPRRTAAAGTAQQTSTDA